MQGFRQEPMAVWVQILGSAMLSLLLLIFPATVALAQTVNATPVMQKAVVIRNFVLPEFPYHKIIDGVEGTLSIDLTVGQDGKVEHVLLSKYELNFKDVPFGIIDGLLQKEQFLKWTFERIGTFVKAPPDIVKVQLTYKIVKTNAAYPLPPKYEICFGTTISIVVTGYLPRRQ